MGDRINKGVSIDYYVSDYCLIDLETTSKYLNEAKIIEIGAIKVRNNNIVSEYNRLINPKCFIPQSVSKVNNITNSMVENAPILEDVIDEFLQFVGNDILVGYNISTFDLNIIYDVVKEKRGVFFSNNYIDVLHAARRCIKNVESHKLEELCRFFDLDIVGEHRAIKDCFLTKQCYEKIYELYGNSAFEAATTTRDSNFAYNTRHTDETLAQRELQGILECIITSDDADCVKSLNELKRWITSHESLTTKYPFEDVFWALDGIDIDNADLNSINKLKKTFDDIFDPLKKAFDYCDINDIYGAHICITGDFNYGDKAEVISLIEQNGGIIDNSVKKGTNYLVVGAKGSQSWKAGNYGNKIQKAIEIKRKGADIRIVDEKKFVASIENCVHNENIPESIHNDSHSWEEKIRGMLVSLIEQYELPSDSLYLSDNYGTKEPDKIISHSICIWEPDYPFISGQRQSQNRLVATLNLNTVKSKTDIIDIRIGEQQAAAVGEYFPNDAEILNQTATDKKDKKVRIRVKNSSPGLIDYLRKNVEYAIDTYTSKARSFGCCSLFVNCSDAEKCLHENKLYAKACQYRKNLEKGNIFYGEKAGKRVEENIDMSIEQSVQIQSDIVVLKSNVEYSGAEQIDEYEKMVRKAIGLPVTKKLVYYKNKRDIESALPIKKYRIVEMYDAAERWYTIEIEMENGEKARIHSSFLKEMQSPSFVSDIVAQEKVSG